MSGRSYLSIGEVLALLRQEFPDVTISKIRFLESQGLVNPERTPSGYRKFFEHDVDRLRWVLRQQREHFLPLKVIKGRLLDDTPGADDLAATYPRQAGEPRHAALAVGVSGARDLRDRGGRNGSGQHLPGFDAPLEEPAGELPDPRSHSGLSSGYADAELQEAPAGRSLAGSVGGVVPPAPAPAPAPAPGGVSLPGAELRGDRSASVGFAAASLGASGTSMTLDEIAAASGLGASGIEELERFGLIAGRLIAGTVCYDEEALTVARLAMELSAFGIEARHLRLYKHAAEREAGFVGQVVLPLLKQRNPAARQRAVESVEQLTRLGQSLRTAFLGAALRGQLGG
ncbi:MAG: MerR family transcriptional regulator [Acidimicrobiales bacterium]